MLYTGLDQALTVAAEQLDEIRTGLLEAASLPSKSPVRQLLHATSYVLIEAVLESVTKTTLRSVIQEINAAMVPHYKLRLSLFTLVGEPIFESLATPKKLGHYEKRIDFTEALFNTDCCVLSDDVLPLDGRTIRKTHFEVIWRTFGFPGKSLSEPRHQFTLETVADFRNDVAHGEADLNEITGRQSITDTLRFVDEMESVILHLNATAEGYLDSIGYRR